MKLVMTLLARNEADIVDAQIAFHLHAGVDFIVATDNRSHDGTTEILERYEREGHLRLIHEPGDDMRQGEWVTRMARLAAAEHGADWVLNSDADEFWWPRGGSLRDVFATIPSRYGIVRGCWRHFLPRLEDGSFFADRMTVRVARPAHPGEKRTIYHAHQKVAHRADPRVVVERGNHNAFGAALEPLRSWHPIEVLHFSLRSVRQAEQKFEGGWMRNPEYDPPLHQLRAAEARRTGRLDDFVASIAVDDEALARGLAAGTLALDTRLRDALRSLRTEDGAGFRLPAPGESLLAFPRPALDEDARYAAEVAPLFEIDGIVRAESRVDALERRLASIERGPLWRLRRLGLLSR